MTINWMVINGNKLKECVFWFNFVSVLEDNEMIIICFYEDKSRKFFILLKMYIFYMIISLSVFYYI